MRLKFWNISSVVMFAYDEMVDLGQNSRCSVLLSLLTLLRNLSEEKEILNLLIYEATAGNFTIEFDSHLYPSITPAQF